MQVIEDQGRRSAGGQGKIIDADRMRASSRFRAALQIGHRQRQFIAWNRTTEKTGSELIQAMALKGQNCYGKKRDTDQHRQFHSSFCEISRSYLLASRLHIYI
jgi:hypothetical protein